MLYELPARNATHSAAGGYNFMNFITFNFYGLAEKI